LSSSNTSEKQSPENAAKLAAKIGGGGEQQGKQHIDMKMVSVGTLR
jgi:hypothetical protein